VKKIHDDAEKNLEDQKEKNETKTKDLKGDDQDS
jgi:hypothetical protein